MADEKTTGKTTPAADEWVAVNEVETTPETKLIFEEIGDMYEGTYLGMRNIPSENGSYSQARFKDDDGVIYFCNVNYSLREALQKVRSNTMVRVVYVDDLDTGQASPMRVFQVLQKRAANGITPSRPGIIRAGHNS